MATLERLELVGTRTSEAGAGLRWEALLGWPGVAAVLLVALVARFVGLDFGLPYSYYPDENKVWDASVAIAGTGDLRPIHFFYPTFWLYVLAAMLKVGVVLAAPFGGSTPVGVASLDNQGYLLAVLRGATALSGTITVAFVYLLGRRLFAALELPGARGYALAAAGFLALSPLHVQHSHIASPDVPMAGFVLLAAYFALRIVEDGRTRWYVLAALATGLAAGTKYPGVSAALMIVVAHVVRCRVERRATRDFLVAALFDRRLWLAGLVTIGSFVATSPYVAIDWGRFRADMAYESDKQLVRGQSGEMWASGPIAAVTWSLDVMRWGLDTPVAVLATLGLGWAAWSLSRRSRVGRRDAAGPHSLAFILVYLLAIYAFSWSWQIRYGRYLVSLLPFACVLAGLGAAFLVGCLAEKDGDARRGSGGPTRKAGLLSRSVAMPTALVVVALLWQADGVVRYDSLLTRPDTRTVAAEWITAHLPPDQPVLTEWYGPSHPNARSMGLDLSDDPLDRYRRRGVRYIATSSYVYNRWLGNPERFPKRAAFYGSLDHETALLYAANPTPDFGYDLSQEGSDGWHGIPLDATARPGPVIRIYQLAP